MASLQEARRDREEAVVRMAEEDEAASNRESRGGIVENIEKCARSLLDAVTGATRDKAQEACDKVRNTKDATKEKAGEVKDGVQDSMEETKEKASEAKDRDTLKLMDYEDRSQGKGGMSEKVGEYKESAAEAARKAREFLVEGKEEARVQLAGKTKDHKGQTNESARKHLEDVKQRSAEKVEEGRGMFDETNEGDKGQSAAENIYGAFPSMTESLKEKMTLPEDVVMRKRGEHGGSDDVHYNKIQDKEEDDIMLHVKEAD